MDPAEFTKRLAALPVEEPDDIDKAMLAEAAVINDGSTVTLEEFRRGLDEYSGRVLLRLPRSLHKALREEAAAEGVSLNQYLLYKLSR